MRSTDPGATTRQEQGREGVIREGEALQQSPAEIKGEGRRDTKNKGSNATKHKALLRPVPWAKRKRYKAAVLLLCLFV
jgi:hypothetical protein